MAPKPRITLKEVAALAGVSYQTVSKVLNHQVQVAKDTEERIWKAAQELGYRPSYTARSLRQQRSQTIGYAWEPSPPDQTNPILDEFLQSMFHVAEQNGYYLLCFPLHADPELKLRSYQELIDTGRVDAFVLSHVEFNDVRIKYLCDRNFPFVAFGRSNQDLCFPYIDVDGGTGIRLVVQHLLEQNHQNIAILAWPEDSRVGSNRLQGYFDGLASAGIFPHPEWIVRGQGNFEYGLQGAQQLLSLPSEIRPTAIIALNDMMAIGAMNAVQAQGLVVGKEIAVTGFDDTPMSRFVNPPLTTLHQPVWEIGERLMNTLISMIDTGSLQEPIGELVAPKLVIRASSVKI